MRRFNKPYPQKKYYLTNFRISAEILRVIDEQGKQIGVLKKSEALKIAQEKELDLILIAPNANPPVAKIIKLSKFLYQEEKKQKEARKGIKKSITKDLKLSLFIGPADFERLVNKGKKFIFEGNQLRINLALKGREITKKEMAFQLINKYITSLENVNISKPPRLEGRVLKAVVSKKK